MRGRGCRSLKAAESKPDSRESKRQLEIGVFGPGISGLRPPLWRLANTPIRGNVWPEKQARRP